MAASGSSREFSVASVSCQITASAEDSIAAGVSLASFHWVVRSHVTGNQH